MADSGHHSLDELYAHLGLRRLGSYGVRTIDPPHLSADSSRGGDDHRRSPIRWPRGNRLPPGSILYCWNNDPNDSPCHGAASSLSSRRMNPLTSGCHRAAHFYIWHKWPIFGFPDNSSRTVLLAPTSFATLRPFRVTEEGER